MTAYAHPFARTDRSAVGQWWWTVDKLLLAGVAALILVGVMMSFASSPAAAARLGVDDQFHFTIRQSIFAAGAAVILLATSMMSPRGVRRGARAAGRRAGRGRGARPGGGRAAGG